MYFFDRIPERWKKILSYVLVAAISVAVTFAVCLGQKKVINYSSTGIFTSRDNKLNEIQEIIEKQYIGDVDEDAMIEAAAAAIVKATGDRWSYYMTPEEYKLYQEESQNAYEGIGTTIESEKKNGGIVVARVDANSGAEKAGLQTGDIITHVEGESLADMTLVQIRDLIRGKKGTSVELNILRGGENLVVLVTRGAVKVDVAKPELLDNDIGMITIANFDERCAKETIAAIEELMEKGAKALIFDVRNNPGGYKNEMVQLLDYLLPEGVLFHSESNDGERTQDSSDADCLKIPMAVLVNGESYSAAEFFAAALEEYNWATTVGEHTTGKGYFQVDISLKDGSVVHLSVGKYYTPKGVSLAEVGGIAPSIEVKLEKETAQKLAEGSLDPKEDPQVQAAVTALLNKLK